MEGTKTMFNSALSKNSLNREELKLFQNLASHFPFFQQAKFSIYKHNLSNKNVETENTLYNLALLSYNRALLFDLKEEFSAPKKEIQRIQENKSDSNELAIPGFKFRISGKVETANDNDPIISDENFIEYEPTAIYNIENQFEESQSNSLKANRTAVLIDGFLNKSREKRTQSVVLSLRPEDDSLKVPDDLVSETLAKIYVKQEKYSEAIELYEKLMLLEPEKKSIFARSISDISSKIE